MATMIGRLKGIFQGGVREKIEAVGLSVENIKAAKSAENISRIVVKLYDAKSNSNLTTVGQLSDSHNFLYVPYKGRIFMEARTFYEDGKLTAQCSTRYHKCLPMGWLDDVCNAVTMSAKIKFEYGDVIRYLTVKDLKGSLDFTLFDNDFSSSFVADSFMVLKAKIFELIQQPPQRVWLMSVAIAGLLGIIFGMTLMAILSILIGYWT